MYLALNTSHAGEVEHESSTEFERSGTDSGHASLYLWKYWCQYGLTAWEEAESILRQAYDAVEDEDRIQFLRASFSALGATCNRSFTSARLCSFMAGQWSTSETWSLTIRRSLKLIK